MSTSTNAATGESFRTLVVSDLHLADPVDNRDCAAAFVSFVNEHAAHPPGPGLRWRLVVAGDLFDLEVRRGRAGPRWRGAPAAIVEGLVADFPAVWRALRAFAGAGNRVVIIPGNHDARLGLPLAAARIRKEIGTGTHVLPHWHDKARGLLVAHGHQLDPDNRFAVWPPDPETDENDASLGVLMTRWFVGPQRFRPTSHVEDAPLANLLSVIRSHGLRAPAIIFGYLWTATRIVVRAPAHAGGSSARSTPPSPPHPRNEAEVSTSLAALSPRSVLESRWQTYNRLYLGRVTVMLAAAVIALLTLWRAPSVWEPWAVLGVILAPLAVFTVRGSLYANRVSRALENGARALLERDDCRWVVFGHLHHRADLPIGSGRYLNAGMFFHRAGGGETNVSCVIEESDGLRVRTTVVGQPAAPATRARASSER